MCDLLRLRECPAELLSRHAEALVIEALASYACEDDFGCDVGCDFGMMMVRL